MCLEVESWSAESMTQVPQFRGWEVDSGCLLNFVPRIPNVKNNLARVLAVSIAALLFAACSGSGLSPAQKERCDQLEAKKKEIEANAFIKKEIVKGGMSYPDQLETNLKQRAEAGC